MSTTSTAPIIERVWTAHGIDPDDGKGTRVSVNCSAGGFNFAYHGHGKTFSDCTITACLGREDVTVELAAGRFDWDRDALAKRYRQLARGHRLIHWSIPDATAMAAQAVWTYVNLPLLLKSGDVESRYAGTNYESGSRWDRLALIYPPHIVTHSRKQVIHVDDTGWIRRHDYTADGFGPWARAAHYIDNYRAFDGITFGSTRRVKFRPPPPVKPRGPIFVWFDAHSASRHP